MAHCVWRWCIVPQCVTSIHKGAWYYFFKLECLLDTCGWVYLAAIENVLLISHFNLVLVDKNGSTESYLA